MAKTTLPSDAGDIRSTPAAPDSPSMDNGEVDTESGALSADSAQSPSDASESNIESSTRSELVRQAAYRRYKERGTAHGDEVQDWLEAEAEINQSLVE